VNPGSETYLYKRDPRTERRVCTTQDAVWPRGWAAFLCLGTAYGMADAPRASRAPNTLSSRSDDILPMGTHGTA